MSAFLVIFILTGQAQNNFDKVYDYNNQAEFAKGVALLDSNKYVVLSSSSNYFGLYTGLYALIIDSVGNVVTSSYIADSTLNYYQELSGSFHKVNSNVFYSGGAYHNQITAEANVILIFYNAELDSFSIIEYPSNSYDGATSSSRRQGDRNDWSNSYVSNFQ